MTPDDAGRVASDLEIEVKRSVADPTAAIAWLERAAPDELAGFRASGPVRTIDVLDRYLDTADGALEGALQRARLRHVGSRVLVTLKGAGSEVAGITTRRELESPATDDLDPSRWPPSPARTEIQVIVARRPLVEQARLRQHRTVRYMVRGGTRVELSLDHLEALSGDVVRAERWELEAELKDGSEADLAELTTALDQIPGVGPALGSKRGFALAVAGR